MSKQTNSASNRLFSGDVDSLIEALELFKLEHLQEASCMDLICEPGDAFPAELRLDATRIQALIDEYNAVVVGAEKAMIERWRESGNPLAESVANAYNDGSYSGLAI